jgi:hypothetical protein
MLDSLQSQTSMGSTSAWLNNWVLRLASGGPAPLAANRLADCQRHTDCGGIGLAVHEQPIGGGGHGGQASWCAAAPGRADGGERRPTMLAWSDEPREVVRRELVEVRCYAGGRGEETPRAVLLGGREVTVR